MLQGYVGVPLDKLQLVSLVFQEFPEVWCLIGMFLGSPHHTSSRGFGVWKPMVFVNTPLKFNISTAPEESAPGISEMNQIWKHHFQVEVYAVEYQPEVF